MFFLFGVTVSVPNRDGVTVSDPNGVASGDAVSAPNDDGVTVSASTDVVHATALLRCTF